MTAPIVFSYPCNEASGDLLSATGGGLSVRDLPAVGTPTTSGGQRLLESGDYFSYYLNDPNFDPDGVVFGVLRFSSDAYEDSLHALLQNGAYELFTVQDRTLLFQGAFGAFYSPVSLADATIYTVFFFISDEEEVVYTVINGVQYDGTWTAPSNTPTSYTVLGIEGTALAAYQLAGTLGPFAVITSPGDGTHDVQAILMDGVPDSGGVNVAGFPAVAADFASAAALQTFLGSINGWAGLVTVTGGSGAFAISFDPSLEDVDAITLDTSTLEQSSRALYSHAVKLRTGAPYTPPAALGRSHPMRSRIFHSGRTRASIQ